MKKIIAIFQIYLIILLNAAIAYAQTSEPDFEDPETYRDMPPEQLAEYIDADNFQNAWQNYQGDREALWRLISFDQQRTIWDNAGSSRAEIWSVMGTESQRELLTGATESDKNRAREILRNPELVPNIAVFQNEWAAAYDVKVSNFNFGTSAVTLTPDENLRLPTGETLNFRSLTALDTVTAVTTSSGENCWQINHNIMCPGQNTVIDRLPQVRTPAGGMIDSDLAYQITDNTGNTYNVDLSSSPPVPGVPNTVSLRDGTLNVPRGAVVYAPAGQEMRVSGQGYEIIPHPDNSGKVRRIFAEGTTTIDGRNLEFTGEYVAELNNGNILAYSGYESGTARLSYDNIMLDASASSGFLEYRALLSISDMEGGSTPAFINRYLIPADGETTLRIGGNTVPSLPQGINAHISDDGDNVRNDDNTRLLYQPMALPGRTAGGTTSVTVNGERVLGVAGDFASSGAASNVKSSYSQAEIQSMQENIQNAINSGNWQEARAMINSLPPAFRGDEFENMRNAIDGVADADLRLDLRRAINQDVNQMNSELPQYAFDPITIGGTLLLAGIVGYIGYDQVLAPAYNNYHTFKSETYTGNIPKPKTIGDPAGRDYRNRPIYPITLSYQGRRGGGYEFVTVNYYDGQNYHDFGTYLYSETNIGTLLDALGTFKGKPPEEVKKEIESVGIGLRRPFNIRTVPGTGEETFMDVEPRGSSSSS